MRIQKNIFIASSGILLGLALPSFAFGNNCVNKVNECQQVCRTKHSDILSQLNCNVQECAIAKVCGGSIGSSNSSKTFSRSRIDRPAYQAPTYERSESRTRKPKTYTPPPRSSYRSSNSNSTTTRSKSELKDALSLKGSSEAKRCISTRRGRSFGTDNLFHLKNNCSKPINYSWCYSSVRDNERNLYKCDITGKFSFSGADSVQPYDENWMLSSHIASVRYGACMKDVELDGKTYGHISTERESSTQYLCNYSTYGR